MARIRSVKPQLFLNEELAAAAGVPARYLFVGLLCLADSAGRLEDRPRRIKAQVYPYDDVDVDGMLSELDRAGVIWRYASGEAALIQIANFTKHQRIHKQEAASSLPAPPETREITRALPSSPALSRGYLDAGDLVSGKTDAGKTESGKGSAEGNGNGHRRARARLPLTAFPEDFTLTDADRRFAHDGGLDPGLMLGALRDHALGKGRMQHDWHAAFRSWCRKELAMHPPRQARRA